MANLLRANRKGLVPQDCASEKPMFTVAELYKIKRLGLLYKIGKKIGIDPTKEEVLAVYDCFCKHDPNLNPIESIKAAAKVHPPSPLWFLFDSELDVIANTAIPDPMQSRRKQIESGEAISSVCKHKCVCKAHTYLGGLGTCTPRKICSSEVFFCDIFSEYRQ